MEPNVGGGSSGNGAESGVQHFSLNYDNEDASQAARVLSRCTGTSRAGIPISGSVHVLVRSSPGCCYHFKTCATWLVL